MWNYLKEENRCYYVATTLVSLGAAYLVKKLFSVLKTGEKDLRRSELVTKEAFQHDLEATDDSNEEECVPAFKYPSSKSSAFPYETSDSSPEKDVVLNTSTLDHRNLLFKPTFSNILLSKTDISDPIGETLTTKLDIPLLKEVSSSELEDLPSEKFSTVSKGGILTEEVSHSMTIILPLDDISNSDIEIFQTGEVLTSEFKILSSEKDPTLELKSVLPGAVSTASTGLEISQKKEDLPRSEQNILPTKNVSSSYLEIFRSEAINGLTTEPENSASKSSPPRQEILLTKSSTAKHDDLESPTKEKIILSIPLKTEQEILSLMPTKLEIPSSENSHIESVNLTAGSLAHSHEMNSSTSPTSKQAIPIFKLVLSNDNPSVDEQILDINIKYAEGLKQEIFTKPYSIEEREVSMEELTNKTTCNDEFHLDKVPLEMIYKILPLSMT